MATFAVAGKLCAGSALGYRASMHDLPPYARLLNLRIEQQDGRTVVIMPFHDDVVGRPGYLHGGAIAGLLEIAAFSTLRSEIGADVTMKPITVTVDYMRPAPDHETFASAKVERAGTSIANVEAFAWQKDREQPIASARINFLLERLG